MARIINALAQLKLKRSARIKDYNSTYILLWVILMAEQPKMGLHVTIMNNINDDALLFLSLTTFQVCRIFFRRKDLHYLNSKESSSFFF